MAKKIAIANQKGGVGKTATSLALSNELGKRGSRVLLIDTDCQANSTFSAGINDVKYTIADVIQNNIPIRDSIVSCKYYDVIPANKDVDDLIYVKDFSLLKAVIEQIESEYDFIIYDTPPAMNMITASVFVACKYVVITSQCKGYSFIGLNDLAKNIKQIRADLNPQLQIAGILFTMVDNRTTVTREIKDLIYEVSTRFDTTPFDSIIRNSIAIEKSAIEQIPLSDFKERGNGYADYVAFTDELLQRIGE